MQNGIKGTREIQNGHVSLDPLVKGADEIVIGEEELRLTRVASPTEDKTSDNSLRTRLGIRSGPEAFWGLSRSSNFFTPTSVMVSGGITELHLRSSQGIQVRSSLVKTDWNSAPKTPAFSIEFVSNWPACLMGGNTYNVKLLVLNKSPERFGIPVLQIIHNFFVDIIVFSFQCFFGALFPDSLLINPILCPLRFRAGAVFLVQWEK